MDTRDFSNLLIKVAGIIIVIVSLKNIPYYIPYYQTLSLPLFLGTVIVPISLPLLIGLFMFNRPGSITRKIIIENDNGINKIENETYLKFEQLALSVLGFYLLFQSISDLIFHSANFFQAKAAIDFRGQQPPSNALIFTPDFIATIAELAFSAWLIFKAKGIVAFVNQIRSAGNK